MTQKEPIVARVFRNGNSQAVRIPSEFRLNATRVEVRRTENGDLILHPLEHDRGEALLDALSKFDRSFVSAVEKARAEQPPTQHRESF